MSGLLIGTTQNVTLEYQPASVGERILAYLLDALVLGAWALGMGMLLSTFFNDRTSGNTPYLILMFSLLFCPILFYDLLCEVFFNGQSIGKKALGLRVLMLDGTQPTLGAYLFRWVFRLIDITLFSGVPAIICIAVTGRGQRIGDLVARTSVIKLRPPVTLDQVVAVPEMTDAAYQVTFPEVAVLTDRDITTLRAALQKGLAEQNDTLLEAAAAKTKQIAGIQTDMEPTRFLQTVLQDYTHLSLQERAM